MELKVIRFNTWEELKEAALKYEQMGYICEARGWDDIRYNRLHISTEEDK